MPTEVIEFFQHHLLTQPYPTWDILYHIIDIRDHEKNRLLEEVLLNAITTLLDAITDNPEKLDQRDKLYNLISNMYISEWCSSRMRQFIFPRMFELKELGILDDGESSRNDEAIKIKFFSSQFSCWLSYRAVFSVC